MKFGVGKQKESDRRVPRSDPSYSFVRSRTISSYAPAGPDVSRISAHDLRRHRLRLVRLLVGCLVVTVLLGVFVGQFSAGTGSLSYSPAVTVTPDEAAIKSTIEDYYSSRPLERFRFLLNERTLGQFLANKLPEIASVQSVTAGGIGSSHVSLIMRTPVASWNVGGRTVYVDSDGISFTHNYYPAPAVEVDDQSGAAPSESTAIASSSMIRYIGQLISALRADGTGNVTRVVLPAGMLRELDVYLEGRGYRVKTQLDRDVDSQAADIRAALGYIDAHGGAQEYVDARVEGKAFYK